LVIDVSNDAAAWQGFLRSASKWIKGKSLMEQRLAEILKRIGEADHALRKQGRDPEPFLLIAREVAAERYYMLLGILPGPRRRRPTSTTLQTLSMSG